MVGVAIAVFLAFLVGLLTSLQLSLITALYALVVLVALGVWVKPRLFNRRWDNPILTLVILIVLASAFGLVGIIIAPPLSAVCAILWSILISHRLASGAAAQVSDLKERQEIVWANIRAMDEPPIPLLTSSMERLTRLIEKAEPILQASLPAEPSELLLPIKSQAEQMQENSRTKKD
jgi:ABC-type transport system involved in multi-copper enzyme maturation permease subunit